MTCSPA
ncbi:TPA_asm: UL43.6 uORF [Human alphaherpesvirus 1]|nr:TPA_asm: UL43.6 uORF [Human alphaherpesvirus 1]